MVTIFIIADFISLISIDKLMCIYCYIIESKIYLLFTVLQDRLFTQAFSNQGISRLSNDELSSRMTFFAKAGSKQRLVGGGEDVFMPCSPLTITRSHSAIIVCCFVCVLHTCSTLQCHFVVHSI